VLHIRLVMGPESARRVLAPQRMSPVALLQRLLVAPRLALVMAVGMAVSPQH